MPLSSPPSFVCSVQLGLPHTTHQKLINVLAALLTPHTLCVFFCGVCMMHCACRLGGQHLPQHSEGGLEASAVNLFCCVRTAVPVPGESVSSLSGGVATVAAALLRGGG